MATASTGESAASQAVAASALRDRVIFALGVPRSGTYWLQRILGAHPQIAQVPTETHLFSEAVAPFLAHFHHGARDSPSVSAIYAERDALIARTRELCDAVLGAHLEPGARMLSERSPWHVREVRLIAEIYPDARFVHIIRDPRDVARSMVAHDWGPDSLAEAARLWRESIGLARAARAPHYLELVYERVLADVPAAARDLYEWLGLAASDDVVAAAAADAEVHVNVDPQRTGVGLAKWRRHLEPDEVAAIEAEAGELMEELGYEPSGGEGAMGAGARPAAPARVAGALRRLGRRGDAAAEKHDPVTAAAAFDRLLTAIHSGRADDLDAVLAEGATVKLVDERGAEILREGADGLAALKDAVRADPALTRPQRSSSVDSTFPTTVGILTYELEDGAAARRVLVASARGERVVHVTLQRI